jgi:flagellar L-ring protein precursor FlgH
MQTSIILRSLAVLSLLSLANCGALGRVSNIGKAPNLHPIDIASDPQPKGENVVVPMPQAAVPATTPNSLWQTGAKGFFKDQRAAKVGDLLTVVINIADEANIANSTSRSRSAKEDSGISNLFGLEKHLPKSMDPSSLLSAGSDGSHSGKGEVDRSEQVKLTVAAVVTQVLPNGNLVIRGRQEVRVNFEVRDLFVSGIVRPEDISSTNTIQHTQIAEARIAYGGRGQLTDVQQPRYGQQLLDIFMPF